MEGSLSDTDLVASHVRLTRELLEALERFDCDTVSALYAEDVEQIEMPNRLKPEGDRRGRAQMLSDLERSKSILRSQKYDVSNAVGAGLLVMAEYELSGVLAVPMGSLAAGDKLLGNCAVSLEFRDGLIVRQRNYDCF
ncbi:MAG: nuclear transport factor 2 family protein [Acidobacteria bacterium]|nr:nuclear transport factor 2 family protein [Acidobacteriota bacterium]